MCVQEYAAPAGQGAPQLVDGARNTVTAAAAAGEAGCNDQALTLQVRLPAP